MTSDAVENVSSVVVTNDTGVCMWPVIESRVDESDTRLWLHLKYYRQVQTSLFSPQIQMCIIYVFLGLLQVNL